MNKAQMIVDVLLGENAKRAAREWLNRVDPDAVRDGIRIEMERTSDYERAKEVALNNVAKDPNYYKKLKRYGLQDVHNKAPQSIRY